jgi:hypothetical protein
VLSWSRESQGKAPARPEKSDEDCPGGESALHNKSNIFKVRKFETENWPQKAKEIERWSLADGLHLTGADNLKFYD